jgi:hypothetical protein
LAKVLTGGYTNNAKAELGFKPFDSFNFVDLSGNITGNRNALGALDGTVGGSPSLQATTILALTMDNRILFL